ncbi:MAG: protein kinase [Verrucomicrobia subdivision 3 bacterium]|nr:protein kinase [Limisphaerales bacterium]
MAEHHQPGREKEIFEAALDIASPEVRFGYLKGACGADAALLERVQELLRAHEATGFLRDQPAADRGETVRISERAESPGERIGRYKIRENLGEGGCGVVYVAEQEEPVRRRVALKVIKLGMDTRAVVARFEAERQALAMMDHPNIAKVLDAGATETGRPYFVMELVRGVRITDYCDQNNLSTRERLDLFIKVCHAIQHAHQKGIIHRDIKPSNILVTLHDGVPVPKVIDFGIAKATEGRLTDATVYTQLHQFIGTPAYISPEQAEMSGLDIDTRSDIYSLGVLLYELLAGCTPFNAEELIASGLEGMRKTIREQEPVRPSTRLGTLQGNELTTTAKRRSTDGPKLVHQLKGDLDWIVMKCLEKDRTRRYDTANGLATDLKRHLDNEPVIARPPSAAYRVQKAVRRHKLAFAAGAAVSLALLGGVAVSTMQAIRATRAQAKAVNLRLTATRAQSEAEVERDRARRNLYAADITLAHQSWLQSNLGKARRLLARTRPAPGQDDLRGWEWRYLWRLTRGDDSIEVAHFNGGVFHLAFIDNDRTVAVGLAGFGSEERGNFLFDLGPTRLSNRRAFGRSQFSVSAYVPAKKWLLSSFAESNRWGISVLNAATMEGIKQLPTSSFLKAIAVSRDGKRIATYQGVGMAAVNVWRTDDWSHTLIEDPSGTGSSFHAGGVGFLGAGERIAIGWGTGKITIHDSVTGHTIREVAAHPGADISAMAISPDSRVIATGLGYYARTIKLWNPESGEQLGELTNHQAAIFTLAFSPDGALLASGSQDQTIRLWNTKTWGEVATLRAHEDEVFSLAFSADGRRLISGGKDGSVRLWQIPPVKRRPPEWVLPEPCSTFAVSPDGRRLVTVEDDYILWDLNSGEKLATLTELRGHQAGCDFSPDGHQLLVAGPRGKIRIWDFERNSLSEFDTGGEADVAGVKTLSTTNFQLASWSFSPLRLNIWNFETRKLVHEFAPSGPPAWRGNFSRQGDMALGFGDGSVTVWKAQAGWAPIDFHAHRRRVMAAAFTPDGRILATGGEEGTAKLWNLATQREIVTLKGHLRSIRAADISPDGSRLITASGGIESVKLWDMNTQQELITLASEGVIIEQLVFSPDGNKIIGRNDRGHVQIWRAPSWAEIEAAEKGQQQ